MHDDFERVHAAADLKRYAAEHLNPIGKSWECPACHSGAGPNRSPAFSIMPDGGRWKCFACGRGGDVFDLAGIVEGCGEDRAAQLRAVAAWAGVEIEAPGAKAKARKADGRAVKGCGSAEKPTADRGKKRIPLYREKQEARQREKREASGRMRAEAYTEARHADIGAPEVQAYMRQRGITPEIAEAFRIGYDPDTRRLIIPYPGAPWYFTARSIAEGSGPKYLAAESQFEVGHSPVWNAGALGRGVVFVVEGQLDAIAVWACGAQAVCTGGNGQLRKVADTIAAARGGFVYLMFDSDGPGRRECDALLMELEDRGAYSEYRIGVVECQRSDPWEWFTSDPEGMRAAIGKAVKEEPSEAERITGFSSRFVPEGGDAGAWVGGSEPLPTGIAPLDKALGGGLQTGVTVVAAEPGAGKSSLAVCVALNAAVNGEDSTGTLFISAEMSRSDIVARAAARVSRESRGALELVTFAEFEQRGARIGREAGWDVAKALEGMQKEDPMRKLLETTEEALDYAAIVDGSGGELEDIGTVCNLIEEAAAVGYRFVIVDYLQCISAGDIPATEKAERDGYVMRMLTGLAKRYGLKMLVLSSVTKAEAERKTGESSAFAAKGSSDIGHDAVAVLRLKTSEVMEEGNRVLDVYIAKNRKGRAGETVRLAFWPEYAAAEGLGEAGDPGAA